MGDVGRNRILVVEDQEELRELWKQQLEHAGYTVLGAGNGDIGQFMLKLEDVDLVISDIKMPKMNGLELTEIIKKKKNIPVILVTADIELSRTNGVQTSADTVLTKPFSFDDLLTTVESFLGSNASAGRRVSSI